MSCEFSAVIRGSFTYGDYTYVVCKHMVFRCNNGTVLFVGRMASSSFADDYERICIFEYGGIIHFIGGGCYYTYDTINEKFAENLGYAPLISRYVMNLGEYAEYEPDNIAGSRVRMHIKLDDTETIYYLTGMVVSVESVYVDGVEFTNYTFTENGKASFITITKALYIQGKSEMVVTYTLDTAYHPNERDTLFRGKLGFVYRGEGGPRLFLYDPDDVSGTVYYSELSHPIGEDAYGVFDYFTEDSKFSVGDGASPVLQISSLDDHVMIFNKQETYLLDVRLGQMETGLDTNRFEADIITNEYGIGKASGTVLLDGALYFYNKHGLHKYTYNKYTYDFITARIELSDIARPRTDGYDEVRLFLNRADSELWLHLGSSVYVYNLRFKKWYLFTGIVSGNFIENAGKVGFCYEKALYLFEEDALDDNGVGFEAVCEAKYCPCESIFGSKTLYSFGAAVDRVKGATLECTLKNDHGSAFQITFAASDSGENAPAIFKTHARLPRSGYFTLSMKVPAGSARTNIRAVMFRYRDIGGRQ